MFEQAKQAIIVYRSKDDEYAHLMANLISANTEYEVAEWDEKNWLANQATTSSSQKVIFLGDSKEARKRHIGMLWSYNQHNMKFGWLGNQCVVDIAPLSPDDFKPFYVYYNQMVTEYQALSGQPILQIPGDVITEDTPESPNDVEVSKVVSLEDGDINEVPSDKVLNPSEEKRSVGIPAIFKKAVAPITNQIITGKLIRFQFNLIIRIFVFNGGLRDFMES